MLTILLGWRYQCTGPQVADSSQPLSNRQPLSSIKSLLFRSPLTRSSMELAATATLNCIVEAELRSLRQVSTTEATEFVQITAPNFVMRREILGKKRIA